jgi:flagellin-like hook-associated protein FlgL
LSATTALTPGSITSISDATTGDTFVYKATAGDTVGSLETAIANAATAGTLSAGASATINASGQLEIGTNSTTAGIVVSSNDSVLGAMSAVPASAVANSYAYVGNSNVNKVQIGDSMNVATNLPGNQLFLQGPNVIGSLNNLITALQSGTSAQIGTAANGITTALNYVNQQRVPLDNTISQLNSQDSYLSQETVTLTSQQTSLVGINMADAATNLTQAETQNDAVLAAAAKVLPNSLLNYLSQPTG